MLHLDKEMIERIIEFHVISMKFNFNIFFLCYIKSKLMILENTCLKEKYLTFRRQREQFI